MPKLFNEFKRESLSLGFDEVLERTWAANTFVDTHTHPFDVSALMVSGEMWLTIGDRTPWHYLKPME